tara:strand:- start:55 stop:312 length:258 start_codon:yes stop_codon:yes gene_type:complete
MNNNIKKIIIFLLISVFLLLIIIKYSVSIIKNEVLEIIRSPKFDTFVINVFDEKLEKLAESDLTKEQKLFYSSKFKKIIKKFDVD